MGKKKRCEKQKNAFLVINWLFERLVGCLISGDFDVEIIDFKKLPDERDRELLGLTDYENKKIFLNFEGGAKPEILIHELGHVFFDEFIDDEARTTIPANEREKWSENKIWDFEECFCASLTQKQTRILQVFINDIKRRAK